MVVAAFAKLRTAHGDAFTAGFRNLAGAGDMTTAFDLRDGADPLENDGRIIKEFARLSTD